MPAGTLAVLDSLTVSAFVRYDGFDVDPNSNTLVMFAGTGNNSGSNALYRVEYTPSTTPDPADHGLWIVWEWGNNNAQLVKSNQPPMALEDGDWHYITLVRDTLANTVTYYVDGSALGGAKAYSADPSGGTDGELALGANPRQPGALNLFGALDEVRVAATARSWEYVALDHKSVRDTLLTYDPVELVP